MNELRGLPLLQDLDRRGVVAAEGVPDEVLRAAVESERLTKAVEKVQSDPDFSGSYPEAVIAAIKALCGWCGHPKDCEGHVAGESPHHRLCCLDYRPLPPCALPAPAKE